MKKLRLLTLAAAGLLGLVACRGNGGGSQPVDPSSVDPSTPVDPSSQADPSSVNPSSEANPYADLKVALLCVHGSYSTYDLNFIEAMEKAGNELGFTPTIIEDVPETIGCYDECVELAELGYDVVFADSFNHEDFLRMAAEQYPDVMFCHATGVKAAGANLPNFANAFASIYEGRYLAGVAAGLRMEHDIAEGLYTADEAKIGYVGAYTYAEIISGFTSFFLGARSIVPSVTMEVKYTGSWYDQNAENSVATELIGRGCKLISQHADSHGAPLACESGHTPNVSYNGSTLADGPTTYLISSKIDWTPYFEYVLGQVVAGQPVAKNWSGGVAEGSVVVTEPSVNCVPGTAARLAEVAAELAAGTRHVFDLSTFKVNGEDPTEGNMKPGDATWSAAETIELDFTTGGYYHESEYRSAPSFDVIIDGITNLNVAF